MVGDSDESYPIPVTRTSGGPSRVDLLVQLLPVRAGSSRGTGDGVVVAGRGRLLAGLDDVEVSGVEGRGHRFVSVLGSWRPLKATSRSRRSASSGASASVANVSPSRISGVSACRA